MNTHTSKNLKPKGAYLDTRDLSLKQKLIRKLLKEKRYKELILFKMTKEENINGISLSNYKEGEEDKCFTFNVSIFKFNTMYDIKFDIKENEDKIEKWELKKYFLGYRGNSKYLVKLKPSQELKEVKVRVFERKLNRDSKVEIVLPYGYFGINEAIFYIKNYVKYETNTNINDKFIKYILSQRLSYFLVDTLKNETYKFKNSEEYKSFIEKGCVVKENSIRESEVLKLIEDLKKKELETIKECESKIKEYNKLLEELDDTKIYK